MNEDIGLTINEASKKANVSVATIRNWIKTKYLVELPNGQISKDSFNNFIKNVAGKEKLNSRANKTKKDKHDHSKLTDDMHLRLQENNSDCLGSDYENSLSDSYRNKEGIYYTPNDIIKDLLKEYESFDKSNLTFCDPSCGSGNFIIEAINIGFKPENIYGFDIDPIAVEITKKRIEDKTGNKTSNIINADFLSLKGKKYDFIFTNPPWGKKIKKEEKDFFGKIYDAGKCLDTSALFFLASLKHLNTNGIIGYLLPESFFNISTFENVRKKSLSLRILRLVDYGRPFKGLLTRAQAIVLKNTIADSYEIKCEYENKSYFRTNKSFTNNPKSILNFYCSDKDALKIEHLYSLPHITLKNNATWGLGIVTGNNSKHAINHPAKNYMPIYKGSDITKKGLKEPTIYIPKDLSLYQQVAPKKLYEANEKIIYKFITSKLCFYNDTAQRYILNSANMFVLNPDFPISSEQLTMLLNSDTINWLFMKIFNTHKVLRSDIEELPIHYTGEQIKESNLIYDE